LDLCYSTNFDSFDTLIKLKNDKQIASIPVIVLSDINNEAILTQSLALGARDYFIKNTELFHLNIKINYHIPVQLNRTGHFSENLTHYHKTIAKNTHEIQFKNKFDALIEELISEYEVNINLIAKNLLTSVSSLERWTKKVYGVTPMKYMVNAKLDKAMYLLNENTYKIKEVVHMVGFSSISYFSSCFKKKFGKSPSLFKLFKELQEYY